MAFAVVPGPLGMQARRPPTGIGMLRGAVRIGVSYQYDLARGKTLGDYNMEAQGDLLADYFALKHLNAPEVMAQGRYANDLKLFEEVLDAFLRNPRDKANLP